MDTRWHLQQDVIPLLAEPWDMINRFPPPCRPGRPGARLIKANGRTAGNEQRGTLILHAV